MTVDQAGNIFHIQDLEMLRCRDVALQVAGMCCEAPDTPALNLDWKQEQPVERQT